MVGAARLADVLTEVVLRTKLWATEIYRKRPLPGTVSIGSMVDYVSVKVFALAASAPRSRCSVEFPHGR
jgi:hypothetical protein